MADIPRISPAEARQRISSRKALLVCAYDSDELFQRNRLAGAISFAEFQERLPALEKEQEIVFYCA